jgi:trypsin
MTTKGPIRLVGIIVVSLLALSVNGSAQRGGGPSKGPSHTARQARPIQLGVSGGNASDIANGYCCSGTLGALVTDGPKQYILSNTHVFAGDSVRGGNNKVSSVGDDVNQSGLIDSGCQYIASDIVADVTDWAPFGQFNIDAAIAEIRTDQVRTDGAILEIGPLANTTAQAFVGQAVKKSGRTTGLTRSSISSLNATVTVGYTDECAGNSFNVTYSNQILISNKGSRFLNSGDSGSVMVEDVAVNPRAVGLLYAGSSSIAVANPIDEVLNHFNVTMVGGTASGSMSALETGPTSAKGLARAMTIQERHARELLSVPGAVGHAVSASNAPVIQILVQELTPRAQAAAPRQLEGVPVVLVEVGEIRGMPFCSKQAAQRQR